MVGKRLSVLEKPFSCRTRFIRSAESSRSMNREGGVQADLFGVLAQQPGANAVVGAGPGQRIVMTPSLSPITLRAIRSTRLVISEAARRENVINRIRRGSAP